MSTIEQRRATLRFVVAIFGWVACLFGWLALLSFHAGDPPATSVWTPTNGVHNWCGPVGARLAYFSFYYFGYGGHALLFLITALISSWAIGRSMRDLWLRLIGVGLVVAAISTTAQLFVTPNANVTVAGPGGVLGLASAHYFLAYLKEPGTLVLIAAALVCGLIISVDDLLAAFWRGLVQVGEHSTPALERGREMIVGATGLIADSMNTAAARLATVRASAGQAPSVDDEPEEIPVSRGQRGGSATRKLAKAAAIVEDADEAEEDEELVDGEAGETYDEDEYETEDESDGEEEEYEEDEDSEEESEDEDEEEFEDDEEYVDYEDAEADAEEDDADEDDEEYDDEPDDEAPPHPQADMVARTRPRPPAQPRFENYDLPALTVLEDATALDRGAIEKSCREKAVILEQTLHEFRIQVQVVAIETGPVITVFELKLAPGIKVSQIASLSNDMARALKAPAVRVVAPLPGKNTIGIEVPNVDKEKVRIKDLARMIGAKLDDHAIPLFLGKDAAGQPLVTDLTRMPHLLIAGTTGSGKSVCVSSIIMSILMTRTPDEVNLILVDPKVVELAMFKDIPHLMCPIVTETGRAEGILDWAAQKMDERYAMLAEAGVKDIRSYNRLGPSGLKERLCLESDEELAKVPVHLPYIVIIIDELADLMMTSAKEVEFYLCRLAQKSRAVGIHLIVSTQRPQANVVTGLIKSNLPCRIAFRVSSRLDSRIVLDQNGAEVLMGQGDMLFLPPGSAKLLRAQGTFISDEELRGIVKHCKAQGQPEYHPELVRSASVNTGTGERDELFDQAVEVILESGRGSVSLLQRKLTIGYGRASRLIDQMYDAGIVGDYKGSQAREVIVTKEEWDRLRNQRDAEESDIGV